jgi:HSP20 family protein
MFIRRLNFPTWSFSGPFQELEKIKQQMERLSETLQSGKPFKGFVPAGVFPLINLTENKQGYYVRAELPGIKAQDIDLQVTGKNLMLSGERKIAAEQENARYHRREREGGKFSRIISLPGEIDSENVEAKILNGILTIFIPKPEAVKPKQIPVKS